MIVTNQRGISIGYMTQVAMDEIHDYLGKLVREAELELAGLHVGPDIDDEHPWWKPHPGMLTEVLQAL